MAQLAPIDIVAPGAAGLNTEKGSVLLPPQWATVATNAVINNAGRISSRKGWSNQTTGAISGTPSIDIIFEYLNESGTATVISTANNKVYKDTDDFTDAANDITSTTAPTADYWQFVNFNGKVIGFQDGHTPIEWSGSGDFTDQSYTGTGPDGNCACAAFGRIWAADADKQTIRVSALLDDTDYSSASGGGTIDMSSIWTQGMDEIVAIRAIGANLVVFGRNHIVFWADGSGSEIGMTLSAAEVVDTIEGTGCIARDSIALTGEGDLIFLSRHGIQSLGRVIESKSNPTVILSKNVRTDVLSSISTQRLTDSNFDQVNAVHSPEEGAYIISFPADNKMYVLDTHHPFVDDDDEQVFPVTTWNMGGSIRGLCVRKNGDLLFGSSGVIGKYATTTDNDDSFFFDFWTGWIDFEDMNHRLKILKEIQASVLIGTGDLIWKWEFDFSSNNSTRTVSYTGGTQAEFSIGQYSVDEFSGGVTIQRKRFPAHGEGQFLRLGVEATVSGFNMVIQHMGIAPKIGRMVT